MTLSNWNRLLERLLAEDLTVAEQRLALTIARCTLGWQKNEYRIGRARLRELSGLDGRNFERARDGLVAKSA